MFPLNLPNALTLARILLVPVLVVALTEESPGGEAIAAGVFALAALTDGLDRDDAPCLSSFPYVGTPFSGFQSVPHGGQAE